MQMTNQIILLQGLIEVAAEQIIKLIILVDFEISINNPVSFEERSPACKLVFDDSQPKFICTMPNAGIQSHSSFQRSWKSMTLEHDWRRRDSDVPFPSATKEIGEVCTRARERTLVRFQSHSPLFQRKVGV